MRNLIADNRRFPPLPVTAILLVCLSGLIWPTASFGQRHPGDNKRLPCAAQPNQKTVDLETRRDYRTCRYQGSLSQPELSARGFMKHYADALGMEESLADIETIDTRRGLASAHSRFRQLYRGIPIFGARLSVHQGRDGGINAFHTNYKVRPTAGPIAAPIVRREAIGLAEAAVGMTEQRLAPKSRRVWFPQAGRELRIAHEVWVYAAKPLGDFLVVVDAHTGKILFEENRLVFATGEGLVYRPNPYQTSGTTTQPDNGDATNVFLDAQRVSVTLERLDEGTGRLKGEFVDVTHSGGKTWNFANESNRIYNYSRNDMRFEEVTVYSTVDQIQFYMHTLGFDDDVPPANGIRDFPSLANAHWNDEDQSFYSTGDDAIHMGDGGVDDGEDADIIAHEFGHAIQHNQNSCWGGGDMGAMGEGFGDYLAGSFYHDVGDAAYQSAHAACIGEWDAASYSSSSPPCLRRIDGDKKYPEDLVGQVHADGEIWSAFLWVLHPIVGPATLDKLVLEHHFALPCNATMIDAANALLQADTELNGGANVGAIRSAACDRGFFSGSDCGGLSLVFAGSPDPAISGEELELSLQIGNDDSRLVNGVLATAEVPDGTVYVAGSASDGGTLSAGNITWPTFGLAGSSSVSRSFRVDVLAPGGGGVLFADDMEVGPSRWAISHGVGDRDWALSDANPFGGSGSSGKVPDSPVGATPCAGGKAGVFSCNRVDLEQYLPMNSIGGGAGNDGWGWTDRDTQKEYVLMGRSTGTSFVDISAPATPIYLGDLPTHTSSSDWRDIRVYNDHAFIVSEATNHGLQIFDLRTLRSVANPPAVFSETAHLATFGSAHNIAINEESGFAYIVGANVCSGGLYIVDIQDPTNPVEAGCFADDGYTHDVQCVMYSGPDTDYSGREICFAYNEDTLTIVDVTDKASPQQISRFTYSGVAYSHQGRLAKSQSFILLDDELDEQQSGHKTKTYILSVADLDGPVLVGEFLGSTAAIDHNLYIEGDFAFQANYTAGLRILQLGDLSSVDICEVASFDVYPDSDSAIFSGAWSVYPFFKSGVVPVMAIEGLALVRPDLSNPVCVGTGEGSGQSWFATAPGALTDQYLQIDQVLALPAGAVLRFWHDYDFEQGYDGAVVEISVNGGEWIDLGAKFVTNGYNDQISEAHQNALGGRAAFSGSSNGYILSEVDLSEWSGGAARIRFRTGTDTSVPGVGWFVDEVSVSSGVTLTATAAVSAAGSTTRTATLNLSIVGDGEEAVCGDGELGFGETCDDGGESETCDADCTAATCGDGVVNPSAGEACDDVGASTTCDADCTIPECGDGVLNSLTGEFCDDGNNLSFDGCSATCTIEEPLSLAARKCLAQSAIWSSKLAIAQSKENQGCAKDLAREKISNGSFAGCALQDRKLKIARLEIGLAAVQASKCTEIPSFGYLPSDTLVAAGAAEVSRAVDDIFGMDAGSVIVSARDSATRSASACQLTVQKFAEKLLQMNVKEFTTCLKKKTTGQGGALRSPSNISECLDTVLDDDRGRIASARDKLSLQITKKCLSRGVALGEALGGDCATETNASAATSCLAAKMACRSCAMMEGVFGLNMDCDNFDDRLDNQSCESGS